MIQPKKTKPHLFCPGPVHTALNVRQAAFSRHNEIGHRELEFEELFRSVSLKLLELFGQDSRDLYESVVITGSGTAANETILSSVIPKGEKILVVSNGEFGSRLSHISDCHNERTVHIKHEWAESISLKNLEDAIQREKPYALAMVHHETSTGMLNPIRAVGALCKEYNVLFIVDTVSSSGAEIIDIEDCNISFCSGSSSKSIGSLPGLSFVVGKKSEFEKLKNIPARTMYLNLYNFYNNAINKHQTPNTPAVQLFFSLEKALENILKETLFSHNALLNKRAALIRHELKRLGFVFAIPESKMSCVLTTIFSPKNIHPLSLRKKLRNSNIIIYAGKGPLEHTTFQIATIGELSIKKMYFLLAALKKVLIDSKDEVLEINHHQLHTH